MAVLVPLLGVELKSRASMGKLPPIAPLFRRWGAWLAFSWVALTGGC